MSRRTTAATSTLALPPAPSPSSDPSELFSCLQQALDGDEPDDGWVPRMLRAAGYPEPVVWDACDRAWHKAVDGVAAGEPWASSAPRLLGWLFTTAYRDAATAAIRHRHSRRRSLPPDIPAPAAGEDGPCPVVLKRLWAAVWVLPRDERRAIFTRYYRGLSLDQVAERLGCSEPKVRRLLKKARRRLKLPLASF